MAKVLMAKADSKSSSGLIPRNVVVAGETGVGKSSFINLLVGANTADVRNDACGVTIQTMCHLWETESRTHAFRLWDTPGLGEGSFGHVSPKAALHALRSLLRELNKEGGVHLLVVCMRGLSRVTKGMKKTYDDVLKIRNQVSPQTPVVAVITELEKQCIESDIIPSMEKWWADNGNGFSDPEITRTFCGHACLTTLPDECHPPLPGRRVECQRLGWNLLIDHSLSFSALAGSMRATYALSSLSVKLIRNIVIVGETGVGKSSTINLVMGKDSAHAASDAHAITLGTSYHDWDLLPTQTFRLWDTPGLGDGPVGSPSPKRAYNAVRALLAELSRGTGVHLLIICFRGGRWVTNRMKQIYDGILALRNHFSPDTPLIAVFTQLESYKNQSMASPKVTRDSLSDSTQMNGLYTLVPASSDADIISKAGTPPDPAPLSEETDTSSSSSKQASKAVDIMGPMNEWWRVNEGGLSSHEMTFDAHACITTLFDDAEPPAPGRRDECQRIVRDLVIDHALSPRSVPAQDMHVILFGETGVGKSSLVNLLAGWHVADISPESVACTFTSTEYQFQLGATTVRLWDTVGLEEPGQGPNGYAGAIEKATELIRRLNDSGGISLFLFCVRGNRVTTTMQSNYRLFYEVLGKKQVPIALAVTHLEREGVMEEWWQRNTRMLEKSGIYVTGHVCITTLEGHPKYVESRNVVRDLLWQYADQGKFSMSSEAWLERLSSGLSLLWDFALPKTKDLTRVLTRRCHLEPDMAQRVATCIETARDT